MTVNIHACAAGYTACRYPTRETTDMTAPVLIDPLKSAVACVLDMVTDYAQYGNPCTRLDLATISIPADFIDFAIAHLLAHPFNGMRIIEVAPSTYELRNEED